LAPLGEEALAALAPVGLARGRCCRSGRLRGPGAAAGRQRLGQRGALPCSGPGRKIQRPPLSTAKQGRRAGSKDKRPD